MKTRDYTFENIGVHCIINDLHQSLQLFFEDELLMYEVLNYLQNKEESA